ncbi:hypothetical protein [Persicirhabdus sediminis]|uniref:OmpA family protein n=1 Tax=Persicirhabdus sediminis TaxID=454144 RepID=A0A8J7SL88_9BACT|nr:hypothetical protein [Persicirhabdus sediminis]MBK1792644.1 hypothetical protein [Persicirhabdus sediminis]
MENSSTQSPRNQSLITGFLIVVVILLFVTLLFSMKGSLGLNQANQADYNSEKSKNQTLRDEYNALRAARGEPPLSDDSATAMALANSLSSDAAQLASIAKRQVKELENSAKLLVEIQQETAGKDELVQSLIAQKSELQTKLDATGDAQNQIMILNTQIADLNDRIQRERANTVALQQTIAELQDKLANSSDRTELLVAREELAKLRAETNQMRYELQRFQAEAERENLYVESAEQLAPKANRLYHALKDMEGVTPDALQEAYTNIRINHNAWVIHRQEFATGDASLGDGDMQVRADKAEMIKAAMEKAQPGAYFLVVGYASKTGDAQGNRKLSADRSTLVATIANLAKDEDQKVRAVYLGQTDRFSTDVFEDNQICEIWEIH